VVIGPAGRSHANAVQASIVAAGAGRDIGRRAARQLARRELARAIYRPPLTQRILGAIGRFVNSLLGDASRYFPGGWWALIALLALAVLVGAMILFWVRPARSAVAAAVLEGVSRSAADHRREAERLAAAGDYASAIIESLRAVAVEVEERGVLPPRPGRTADELAAEAAAALPGQAGDLAAAAKLFDDVRYGGRPGSAAGYQRLRELDARIRAARIAGQAPRPTATAGPRG
jgi:hypothetical protein